MVAFNYDNRFMRFLTLQPQRHRKEVKPCGSYDWPCVDLYLRGSGAADCRRLAP